MKLLIDMNLSPGWVDFLASAGIAAEHWAAIGARDAMDSDIMAFAAAREFVVLTHDLDFGAILAATNGAKPSVCAAPDREATRSTISGGLVFRRQGSMRAGV